MPRCRWSTLWMAWRSTTTRPSALHTGLDVRQAFADGGDLLFETVDRRLQPCQRLAQQHGRLVGRLEVVDHPAPQLAHREQGRFDIGGQLRQRLGLLGKLGQDALLQLLIDPPVEALVDPGEHLRQDPLHDPHPAQRSPEVRDFPAPAGSVGSQQWLTRPWPSGRSRGSRSPSRGASPTRASWASSSGRAVSTSVTWPRCSTVGWRRTRLSPTSAPISVSSPSCWRGSAPTGTSTPSSRWPRTTPT